MKVERLIAGLAADLEATGRLVLEHNEERIVVFWNDGEVRALNDTCIHRKRELSTGTIFNGRIVCPGHQWSFDLTTGFCRERERFQPVYPVAIEDGNVVVDYMPRPAE